jgi:class 3 adenylate cyclase
VGCAQCGFTNEASDHFCGGCGSSLTRQSSVQSREAGVQKTSDFGPQTSDARLETLDPRPITYTPAHLAERIRAVSLTEGERKTITALFADLKGSTASIEELDPEEARAIIDPALQVIMDAVHRYEGYVAQALGDGIFALFGAPIAHEDHPQRAAKYLSERPFVALRMTRRVCQSSVV